MHSAGQQISLALALMALPALALAQDGAAAPEAAVAPTESAAEAPSTPETAEPAPTEGAEAAPGADDEVVASLAEVLSPGNVEARVAAVVELCARRDDPTAVASLLEVLRSDPSPEVRAHAIHALACTGSAEARAAIGLAQYEDPDERVTSVARLVETQTTTTRTDLGTRNGSTSVMIGIILSCLSYGVSVLSGLIAGLVETSDGIAAEDGVGWWYLMPLAGPFLAAPRSDAPERMWIVGAIDSLFQATAIAMLFVGLGQHLRYGREARERALIVTPTVGDGAASLSVMGAF